MSSNNVKTSPPSNDESPVGHDHYDDDSGEIQEEGYDPLNFHVRPTERHLWDSTGAGWTHEDTISMEDIPRMWSLYKQVTLIVTGIDFVVIPDDYLID